MIYLYSGTPGSGKSLHLTKDILNYLKYRKALVLCSEPVKIPEKYKQWGEFRKIDKLIITPDELYNIAVEWFSKHKMKEHGILLIIDEAGDIFNPRTWGQAGRMEWLAFFRMHRHYGFDVILAAQEDRQLDRQIRGVIQQEWRHKKLANYGLKGWIFSKILMGNWICCQKKNYSDKIYCGCEWMRGCKKYYNMYNTFEGFNLSDKKIETLHPDEQEQDEIEQEIMEEDAAEQEVSA